MKWNKNEIARYGRATENLDSETRKRIEALNATFGTRQFGGGGGEKLAVGKVYEILPMTRGVQTAEIGGRAVTWPAVQTTEGVMISFGKLAGHRLQYDAKFIADLLAEKVEDFAGLASSEKELLACTKPRTRAACALLAGYSLALQENEKGEISDNADENKPFFALLFAVVNAQLGEYSQTLYFWRMFASRKQAEKEREKFGAVIEYNHATGGDFVQSDNAAAAPAAPAAPETDANNTDANKPADTPNTDDPNNGANE